MKKLLFMLFFFFASYNFLYATGLTVSIEGGTSKEVYYNENINFNAIATFQESCISTGITWTKTIPGFPFPSIITLGTGPSLTTSFTANTNITVTASCDALSVVTFIFVTIKNPTVNAGTNTNYNSGDIVNLSGSIIGTDPGCSVFNYAWEQLSGPEILINNSIQNELNSHTYNNANFVFPDTSENIILKLNVTPQSCFHAGNTYSGTVTYTKNTPVVINSRGRSYSSRMREEAEKLFYDTGSIEQIQLNLNLEKQNYSPILNFDWDIIGGDGQVNYILEYSTGSNFLIGNTVSYNTKKSNYTITKYSLLQIRMFIILELKSEYLGKQSNYSNVVKYYSEDYFLTVCNKEKKVVRFDNIFDSIDFLLDDIFQIKCMNCRTK